MKKSLPAARVFAAALPLLFFPWTGPAEPQPLPQDPKAVIETPSWASLDFQERLRFEARENNFDFNGGNEALTDDSWLLQRARLGLKLVPRENLTLYVQGQSSFELESDRPNEPGVLGAEGDDPIDLRQAYLAIGSPQRNLTLGRQLLLYGDERLVGSFEWNNFGRTFDAVKFHLTPAKDWWLEGFASSVVVHDSDEFNRSDLFNGNGTGRDQIFSGLYLSTTALCPLGSATDFYAFELHEESAAGGTDFVTLGTRLKANLAKTGGWDFETEMAVQAGDLRGQDLGAFAGHWGAGRVWTKAAWKPRLFGEYNFATGDSDRFDDETGTFQNLFPTNHKFYGYMDLFAWQNLHNPAASFSVQPKDGLKFQLDYHGFWLADTNDAWYRANGVTQVRPIVPDAGSFVGTELDLTATWKVHAHLGILAGYSHFFSGDYAEATGAADDADFGYLQAVIDF